MTDRVFELPAVWEDETHTPAPWFAERDGFGETVFVDETGTFHIATIRDAHEEDEQLMLAAPDLLAALKVMVAVAEKQGSKWREKLPEGGSPLGVAHTAILKAEGRAIASEEAGQ